jgi:hypothetical protein
MINTQAMHCNGFQDQFSFFEDQNPFKRIVSLKCDDYRMFSFNDIVALKTLNFRLDMSLVWRYPKCKVYIRVSSIKGVKAQAI